MIRLILIDAIEQKKLMQFDNAPVLPVQGDVFLTPDNKLLMVTQRLFAFGVAPKLVSVKEKVSESIIEVRCLVQQIHAAQEEEDAEQN